MRAYIAFQTETRDLNSLTQSGQELFSLSDARGGRLVIFASGIPSRRTREDLPTMPQLGIIQPPGGPPSWSAGIAVKLQEAGHSLVFLLRRYPAGYSRIPA